MLGLHAAMALHPGHDGRPLAQSALGAVGGGWLL